MFSAEQVQKAKDRGYPAKANKQVMGIGKIQHPGEPAYFRYTLEDGSTVAEDETGKAVSKIPDVSAALKQKRQAKK